MTVNGEQLEIVGGDARAVVNQVGACVRVLEVDDRPYTETYSADVAPPLGCGAVLVPWPNRVAGGRWEWNGEPQQLALTEPERGNAIHGLVRSVAWERVDQTPSSVTLGVGIDVQPGWPVTLHTTVRYALGDDGLQVTHTVTNIGRTAVPFGVGAHPYPRAGTAPTDECTLRLSAASVLPLDTARMVPAGDPVTVEGTDFDFRVPRSLRGIDLDTPFTACTPVEGETTHELIGPDAGVQLWTEPAFGWVQVFTANGFPARGRAVAIEPMTCPPNALQTGVDLITLDAGDTWSASWGIRPLT
jgi:aldose 1-epimerase